jgi:hypothetical protein
MFMVWKKKVYCKFPFFLLLLHKVKMKIMEMFPMSHKKLIFNFIQQRRDNFNYCISSFFVHRSNEFIWKIMFSLFIFFFFLLISLNYRLRLSRGSNFFLRWRKKNAELSVINLLYNVTFFESLSHLKLVGSGLQ